MTASLGDAHRHPRSGSPEHDTPHSPSRAVDLVSRFAPTPSGRMHLGNITAMLAAWLSVHADVAADAVPAATAARGDQFSMDPAACVNQSRITQEQPGNKPRRIVRLRIEDLDRARSLPDAGRWIMDDLQWLGLQWDGEPVYQSQRTGRYEQVLAMLAAETYPCFCSRADIRAASAPQQGDGFMIYPGTCRSLLREHPQAVRDRLRQGLRHSIRLALPEADDPRSTIAFNDLVFGMQHWNLARDIGDPVIRRSDGVFAYQLAVAVDDLDMGITRIVRGRDLLRSTALQLWIRRLCAVSADGAAPRVRDVGALIRPVDGRPDPVRNEPVFAHIPLVDDPMGRRLAKRERAVDMGTLRAQGLTPEQIIGYCAWLLGVRVGDDHGHANKAPMPMTAREVASIFSWKPMREDHRDRVLSRDLTCIDDAPLRQ